MVSNSCGYYANDNIMADMSNVMEMMNSEKDGDEITNKSAVTRVIAAKTISNSDIELNIITHSQKLCQEFIIKSPQFSVLRWLMWSCILYVIGYYLQLHLQDLQIMGYVFAILIILLLIKLHFKVKSESLLVIASIGVQLTTTFASGRTTSMFYDMAHVKDIVINEGISMHRVIYYLAILLNQQCLSSNDVTISLVPLWTHSWPAFKCLLEIRREVVQVLRTGKNQITSKTD